MTDNPVAQRIRAGGVSMGVMCLEFATTGFARLTAGAGAEFAVYDLEHTGWSLETVKMLIATGRGAGLTPIVRVPTTDYHHVAHVMDIGAMGLVIPLVESADQIRRALGYAKYPPAGVRGCAFGLSHDDYRGGDLAAGMAHANGNVLVIAQVETVAGLNAVEEIAAVPGGDALWVGQFDLTASLGIPGQFDHPLFRDATRRVVAACHANGIAATLAAASPEELAAGPANGFRLLVYLADLWIYQQAVGRCMKSVREANGLAAP